MVVVVNVVIGIIVVVVVVVVVVVSKPNSANLFKWKSFCDSAKNIYNKKFFITTFCFFL